MLPTVQSAPLLVQKSKQCVVYKYILVQLFALQFLVNYYNDSQNKECIWKFKLIKSNFEFNTFLLFVKYQQESLWFRNRFERGCYGISLIH